MELKYVKFHQITKFHKVPELYASRKVRIVHTKQLWLAWPKNARIYFYCNCSMKFDRVLNNLYYL